MKTRKDYHRLPALAFMVMLLCALSGFKTPSGEAPLPAPVEEPCLLLYHNFRITGIYDGGDAAAQAINRLSNEMASFIPATKIEKAALEEMLVNVANAGDYKPEELFFYFRNPGEFALIIRGEFNLQAIKSRFAGEVETERAESLLSRFKFGIGPKKKEFFARFLPQQILVGPEEMRKELERRLENGTTFLQERFKAFVGMLKGKPALALEIDTENFLGSLAGTLSKPPEMAPIRHVRLIADDQLAKMQLFIPEDEPRNQLSERLSPIAAESVRNLIEGAELSLQQSGRSLFVEAEANSELERLLAQKFAAWAMHFFIPGDPEIAAMAQKELHESKQN